MAKKSASKFIIQSAYNGGVIVGHAKTLAEAEAIKEEYFMDFVNMNGYDPNCLIWQRVGNTKGYLPLF
jgi:hypothetical protein